MYILANDEKDDFMNAATKNDDDDDNDDDWVVYGKLHFSLLQYVIPMRIKVDVHGKNVAVFIALYDFPSFHETFFLRSIV